MIDKEVSNIEITNLINKIGKADLIQLLDKLNKENEILKVEVEGNKGKISFYDTVTQSDKTVDMKETAKVLNYQLSTGKNLGRNTLFKILREKGILMRDNMPYQRYVDLKYFDVCEIIVIRGDYSFPTLKTTVFQKGIDFIKGVLDEHFNNEQD